MRTWSTVTTLRFSRGRAAMMANASDTIQPVISTRSGAKLHDTAPVRVTIAIMTEMIRPLMLISMFALLSASWLSEMWFS